MSKHDKIKNASILSEFPTLDSLMQSKEPAKKKKKKKNFEKLRDFRKGVFEDKENKGDLFL